MNRKTTRQAPASKRGRGRPPVDPAKRLRHVIALRLTDAEHAELSGVAEMRVTTIGDVVREAITAYVREIKAQ